MGSSQQCSQLGQIADVVLRTTTSDTVTPVPFTITTVVAPTTKSVPVRVMLTVVPGTPLAGLTAVNTGAGDVDDGWVGWWHAATNPKARTPNSSSERIDCGSGSVTCRTLVR